MRSRGPREAVVLFLAPWLLLSARAAERVADPPRRGPVPSPAAGLAQRILEESGVSGGLIVEVGCGEGALTAALRAGDRCIVHGLDTDAGNVEAARRTIRSLGIYGPVSVDRFDGSRLPYAENLVNLVVSRDLGGVPMAEVMRVLRPGGVATIRRAARWEKTVKPWPEDIDEWTHYLHGPDGNPVARDRVVGPPVHFQWTGGPLWLRSHESDSSVRTLVTARGRLFTIVDEAPASLLGEHAPPDEWFLAARDAFNGILLWKVPIRDWGWRAWKPSWFTPRPGDIPLNIQKRLVAAGERVYTTLGYRAPVSELDARTGRLLRTYEGTDRTAEILYEDGALILTLLRDDRAAVARIDARSGRRIWISENEYRGTTTDYYRFRAMHGSVPPAHVDPTLNIATDGAAVALLDGGDVVCLDYRSGRERWRTPFPLAEADARAGGIRAKGKVWVGTLIVRDGVILHASPNRLAAFAADSGRVLWTQPKRYLGHLWYEWKDVFVIGELVWTWSAEIERGRLEGGGRSSWPRSVNGYDLRTGRLVKEVPLGNVFKTYHHHRCYRDKATVRYILASRRGTEYIDLERGGHTIHNWVRGTCHVGMMPANGLQYAPPHPCVCYMDEKLKGFNALASARPAALERMRRGRPGLLRKGPAYGEPLGPAAGEEDWPTFRGDAMRTGRSRSRIPLQPRLLWRRRVGRTCGPPVAVGDRVFVPVVDEHRVTSLKVSDGEPLWEYVVGARIDAPPTYWRGRLLFGSADGCAYCVRADDGRLAWRIRAGPDDRLVVAFDRLGSAWPVHGSVLVMGDTAYFAAGRSSHLDGGIYMFGVDPSSGRIRCRARLQGPSYHAGAISQNFRLPMGALPDILQADGTSIYMGNLVFGPDLARRSAVGRGTSLRIRAKGGFLDGSYFKRIPWVLGGKGNYGRLIVRDDRAAYLVRMFDTLRGLDPKVFFTPGAGGYLLTAVDLEKGKPGWKRRIRVRVRAMAVAENALMLAGPPDVVDPDDPLGAFEGRKGGILWICDKTDGRTLWRFELPSPPVFNGMAAAGGRLFVALRDGSIACFGD